MIDFTVVITSQWYFTIPLLVAAVGLLGWAMYQLSGSLHVAATVVVGTFILAGVSLYVQARALSVVAFVLAASIVVLLVLNEWRQVNGKYNKAIKESVYDVEEKR